MKAVPKSVLKTNAASALRRHGFRLDRSARTAAANRYRPPRPGELLAEQPRAGYPLPAEADRPDEAAERERRRQILARVRGMWLERADAPADGLRYQREARAEWD